MLIFLRCTGEGVDETVLAIPDSKANVGDLKDLLLKLRPQYKVRHIMFAGKMLNENHKSLDSYGRSYYLLVGPAV